MYRNLDLIQRHRPDLVAVFAADHVYRMDVGQMVCFHEACGADVTVSAARVPIDRARAFGVLATGPSGEICSFEEKPEAPTAIPDDPTHAYVSMGNYLFDPDVLAGLLLAGHSCGATDFGHDILPRLPGRQRIYAYDFARNYVPGVLQHEERSYWRDVGTLEALRDARRTTSSGRSRSSTCRTRTGRYTAPANLCMSRLPGACPPKGRAWSALRLSAGRPEPQPSVA